MTPNNYPEGLEGLDELAKDVAKPFITNTRYMPDWQLKHFARAFLDALAERGYVLVGAKKQEPVVIQVPNYNHEAMGCDLEDRGITDRYEAMQYGWDCAVERVLEQVPDEPLYTHPAIDAAMATNREGV